MLKPFYQEVLAEAGCDEAGRGCLAGPVFAAAVILPAGFHHPLLNDSKQLGAEERDLLREVVCREAEAWAVAAVENTEIDRINILQASIQAMHLAVDRLHVRPGLLLVDGNRFNPYPWIPHVTVVKGDATYASIAAASILAKTFRDARMEELHRAYPQYGWNRNKGYPTKDHRAAIAAYGPSPLHRVSFRWQAPGEDGE